MEKVLAHALVRSARCPLRARPDPAAPLVDEILAGWPVEVLECQGPWRRLRTDYRYEGWAPAWALALPGAGEHAAFVRERSTVFFPFVDVLSAPRFQSATLATLPRGAWVRPLGRAEDFAAVQLADGRLGYLKPQALSPDGLGGSLTDRVRAAALSYLGAPYRWGGKTPRGLDCSGLTFMAYRLAGAAIFRDAALHPDFPVVSVPAHARRPGDLLYYPGHVALYLGEGQYIHASASAGRVVLGSLEAEKEGFRADLAPEALVAVGRYEEGAKPGAV